MRAASTRIQQEGTPVAMIPRLNPATPSISAWEASAPREWTKLARPHGRRRTMFAQARALIQFKMRQVSARIERGARETGGGAGHARLTRRVSPSLSTCAPTPHHFPSLALSSLLRVALTPSHRHRVRTGRNGDGDDLCGPKADPAEENTDLVREENTELHHQCGFSPRRG